MRNLWPGGELAESPPGNPNSPPGVTQQKLGRLRVGEWCGAGGDSRVGLPS